jgi:hypothetical protein
MRATEKMTRNHERKKVKNVSSGLYSSGLAKCYKNFQQTSIGSLNKGNFERWD